MRLSPTEILDAFLNYPEHRVYPSLWDSSLACAFGPLCPEGSTLIDRSGRTAGAAWSVGAGDVPKYAQGSEKGQAFWAGSYDGSSDYGVMPNVSTTAGTCSAWVKLNTVAVANTIFSVGVSTADEYLFLVCNTTRLQMIWQVGGAPKNAFTNTGVISAGTWLHLAWTSAGRMFLNAREVAYQSNNWAGNWSAGVVNANRWNLGVFSANVTNSYINGAMSSFRLHSRVLTDQEIALLARHPLAAYEVELPPIYTFPSSPTTAPWLWAARRNSMIGSGLGI